MKCAGVGVEHFSKNTHVQCGSVRSEKILCAECAGVPELAAHKYSGQSLLGKTNSIDKIDFSVVSIKYCDRSSALLPKVL